MKLLLDMNLSPRWTVFLDQAGIQAQHWSILGDPRADDTELMSFAAQNGYVVLTQDLDFGSILAITGGNKPSVVQLRAGDLRPESIGGIVVTALKRLETEITFGALVTIEPERVRMSFLPLQRD